MQRTLGLLMRNTCIVQPMWLRGPKKAKAESVPLSDDLINVWKDRKDPEIKDIDEYPVWLLELAVPLESPFTASIQIATGSKHYIPPSSHVRSMIRSLKRDRIQQMNIWVGADKKKGDVIMEDDLNDQEDSLEHIQQEKAEAEALAEEAARLAELEEDDEDSPKAKKPAIKKEEDDDDKPKAGGDKSADKGKGAGAAKGGASAGAAKKK